MRVIFDMASTLQTCHRAGKDVDGFEVIDNEGTKHWINSAAYGYENTVNSIKATLQALNCTPIDAVLVLEGMNSKSKRLMLARDYKANRGKAPYQAYDEYNKCKDQVVEVFRSLGAIAVTQDNVEGDDIVAYIARNSQEDCTVVSNDNDLAALYGINKRGAKVNVRINGVLNENKYGDFPLQYITLYKALVGDSSDKISGIPGFGPAKWIDVHNLHLSNAIALLHRNDKLIGYLEDGIDGGKALGYVVENIVYVYHYDRQVVDIAQIFLIDIGGV